MNLEKMKGMIEYHSSVLNEFIKVFNYTHSVILEDGFIDNCFKHESTIYEFKCTSFGFHHEDGNEFLTYFEHDDKVIYKFISGISVDTNGNFKELVNEYSDNYINAENGLLSNSGIIYCGADLKYKFDYSLDKDDYFNLSLEQDIPSYESYKFCEEVSKIIPKELHICYLRNFKIEEV